MPERPLRSPELPLAAIKWLQISRRGVFIQDMRTKQVIAHNALQQANIATDNHQHLQTTSSKFGMPIAAPSITCEYSLHNL
jgi:hypothetical protein